jgi:glycosyltransferase involved in cell wall biosynthesis
MVDAYVWRLNRAYAYLDTIICPSRFLKGKLDRQSRFADKTVALHNFIEPQQAENLKKGNYVLEFGHLCRDKGTLTLLEVAKRMPNVRFLFAGYGAAETEIAKVPNAEYVGFKTGKELKELIAKALCSVYPSEWYENCPFSVMESQMYGTPVLGANIGGIPELIKEKKTGELFICGDKDDLIKKISSMWNEHTKNVKYIENCVAEVYAKRFS